LVVYHGTSTGGFSEFDEERRGGKGGHHHGGWSFTTDKDMAEKYALGFGRNSVTIGEAFRIANKALRDLEDNPQGKSIALKHWKLSEEDELPEFKHENLDDDDMDPWADDIKSLAEKVRTSAPTQSTDLEKASSVMKSGKSPNPMIYQAYLRVPQESPEFEATTHSIGSVLQSVDVRNLPGKAVVVNLDDGNKVFIVADQNQIRFMGKNHLSTKTGALRVVKAFLERSAAQTIPDERMSKVDKGVQTTAVEKLLKDAVTKMLPEYRGKVYAVGGYVRDSILGNNPKDIDMVIDVPEDGMEAAEKFAKKLADKLGVTSENNPSLLKDRYGIWGVALLHPKDEGRPFVYDGVDVSGYVLELTPPREEGPYNQKREPEWVKYTTLEDDAKRRDLTVNALYQDIASGKVKDFVGGIKDLKDKKLRPPPHPGGVEQIYREDPLRIFRIIRFKGKLPGFDIDKEADQKIRAFAKSPEGKEYIRSKVSKERIKEELHKIITHPDGNVAAAGLDLMRDMDVLEFVSPALVKLLDVSHDDRYGHTGESGWDHTLDVLRRTPPTEVARLGALFHDIGKPASYKEKEDKGEVKKTFGGHAEYGVALARKALLDLKFKKETADAVAKIVHAHMLFSGSKEPTPEESLRLLRTFLQGLYDNIDDAMAVIEADQAKHPESAAKISKIKADLKKLKEDDVKKGLLAPSGNTFKYVPPMTGDELMAEYKELSQDAVLGDVMKQLKRIFMGGRMEVPGSSIKDEARKAMQEIAYKAGWEKQLKQKVQHELEARKKKKKEEKEKGRPPVAEPFETLI